MKPWLKYTLFGSGVYLFALLLTLPVRFAYQQIEQRVPAMAEVVQMEGLSGSVWDGSANELRIKGKRYGAIAWQLQPFHLLLGEAALDLRFSNEEGYLDGRVAISFGGRVTASDVEGRFHAGQLMRLLPPFLPLVVDGQVVLNLREMRIEKGFPNVAEGVIVWSSAALTAPQALTLGDLRATLSSAESEGITVALEDNGSGPLELSGGANLTADGEYQATIALLARESAAPHP